jgi:hypothetical protein
MAPRSILAAFAGLVALAGIAIAGGAVLSGNTFSFWGEPPNPDDVHRVVTRGWLASGVLVAAAGGMVVGGARVSALLVPLPGLSAALLTLWTGDGALALVAFFVLAPLALAGTIVGALPGAFRPLPGATVDPRLKRQAFLGLPTVTLISSVIGIPVLVAFGGGLAIFGVARRDGLASLHAAALAFGATVLALTTTVFAWSLLT